MKFLVLLTLLIPFTAYGKKSPLLGTKKCKLHTIYCHIKTIKPSIDSEFAFKLSNLLYIHAKKQSKVSKVALDPHRSVAIAMQESGLTPRNRQMNFYIFEEVNGEKQAKKVTGITDVGLWQFHIDTIRKEKLNPIKLESDLEYGVIQHFKLLAKKIKLCKDLDESWACYHSKTPRFRDHYIEKVNRFYYSKDYFTNS